MRRALLALAIVFPLAVAVFFGLSFVAGATSILITGPSDTLTTFRTNSNTNFTNLNDDKLEFSNLSASWPILYDGSGGFSWDGIATSTIPTTGYLALWTGSGTLGNIATSSLGLPQFSDLSSFLTNITGLISAGTNISITGSGTTGSPYVINAHEGIGTSTTPTSGHIPYWATTNTLGSIATTSVSCTGTVSCTSFIAIGASPITILGSGGGGGTVTSVDMSIPTGFFISGNPITSSGTLALDYQAGYSLLATTTLGSLINGATAKTTPADNDMFGLMDSAASNLLKKFSWANLKTAIAAFFTSLPGVADGSVLTASSTATYGMEWAQTGGGGSASYARFGSSGTSLSTNTETKVNFNSTIVSDAPITLNTSTSSTEQISTTTSNTSSINLSGTQQYLAAQSVTMSKSGFLTGVRVRVTQNAGSNRNFTVYVKDSSYTTINSVTLATNPTSMKEVNVNTFAGLSEPIFLQEGQTYYFLFQFQSGSSYTKSIGYQNTDPYANGSAYNVNDSTGALGSAISGGDIAMAIDLLAESFTATDDGVFSITPNLVSTDNASKILKIVSKNGQTIANTAVADGLTATHRTRLTSGDKVYISVRAEGSASFTSSSTLEVLVNP